MTRTIGTKISLALAMTAATVALIAVPAAAAGPFPAPLCGAFNMVKASPSFYDYAVSDGMDTAMTGLVQQGVDGMFGAVANTTANSRSPGCRA
jgi:hypothetical protein